MTQRGLFASVAFGLSVTVLAPLATLPPARAQSYPDRTVRIIVPTAPGGSIDTTARVVAGIVEKLNKEINAGLADPGIKARLAGFGGTVLAGSPGEFGKLIAEETEKWAKVVKFAGMKPEPM